MVPRRNAPLWKRFLLYRGIYMKKYMVEQQFIISMYEYFVHYCQLEERVAFRYCNYPHERIREVVHNRRIGRFPIAYYQDEYAKLGLVVWVIDRTGKKLPYVNPLLLGNLSAQEIIARLWMGTDPRQLLEHALKRTDISVVPVTMVPELPGYTRKKSYQKKIDQKRREWLE